MSVPVQSTFLKQSEVFEAQHRERHRPTCEKRVSKTYAETFRDDCRVSPLRRGRHPWRRRRMAADQRKEATDEVLGRPRGKHDPPVRLEEAVLTGLAASVAMLSSAFHNGTQRLGSRWCYDVPFQM